MGDELSWLDSGLLVLSSESIMTEESSNGRAHDPAEDLPFTNNSAFNEGEFTVNELKLQEMVVNGIWNQFRRFFKEGDESERNVNRECQYPEQIGPDAYRDMYDRDALSARVVQVLPKESWQIQPEIYEDEDPEVITPFEQGWKDLHRGLGGDDWYQDEEGSPIWEYLLRLDILSGIGHYGVMLLGIDDGRPLDMPIEEFQGLDSQPPGTEGMYGPQPFRGDAIGYDNYTTKMLDQQGVPWYDFSMPTPVKPDSEDMKNGYAEAKGENKGGRKLVYLKVFDETIAQITRYERDPHNPRFGLPQMYLLTFNDPRNDPSGGAGLPVASSHCHWSRLIHVADNRGSNETLGYPRMKQVFNRLLDAYKVYGASGEGFWQQAFAMLSLETNPALGGDIRLNADDRKNIQEQLNAVRTKLKRHLVTAGMTVKTLPPALSDPTPYINAFIEVLCIFLGIPVRVFKGSERGELASTQDDSTWNDRLKHRQLFHLTPRIMRPFINRLIRCKVLPEPVGYSVVWPDLDAATDDQKAATMLKFVQAMQAFIAGQCENMMTPFDFYTIIGKLPHAQAKQIIENAQKAMDTEEQMTVMTPEEQQEQTDAMQPTEDPVGGDSAEKEGETATNSNPQGHNQYTMGILSKLDHPSILKMSLSQITDHVHLHIGHESHGVVKDVAIALGIRGSHLLSSAPKARKAINDRLQSTMMNHRMNGGE